MNEIDKLEERVDRIENELARYKGFVGGVVFIVSALFTALMFVKDYFR